MEFGHLSIYALPFQTVLPKFFLSLDIPRCEQTDAGKPQVLGVHKHLHRNEVGFTQMIDEPRHVPIATGVYTVGLSILNIDSGIFYRIKFIYFTCKASLDIKFWEINEIFLQKIPVVSHNLYKLTVYF